MALNACVDCGRPLSPTATGCNGCNSTDPFGAKRAADRLQMQFMIAGIVCAGLVWLAFHFDILTFEMVKNFLHKKAQ